MMTYYTKTEPIDNGKGWNYLTVSIFSEASDAIGPIGTYIHNYPNLYQTFYPFTKDGKDYALYSRDYTATRVMALPSCEDMGGEERAANGFCPVEYYVPPEAKGRYGFVAGCVWGDDTSWKIQFLDLREVDKGIVKRDDRFGYIELPDNLTLAQAVQLYEEDENLHYISLAVVKRSRLDLSKDLTTEVFD